MTTTKLPRFEGREVIGAQVKITNTGDGLSKAVAIEPRTFKMGETVHVVLECEATDVVHRPVKDVAGLLRLQVLKAGVATIVDAELVADVIEAQRLKIEEAEGVHRLPLEEQDPDDDGDGE